MIELFYPEASKLADPDVSIIHLLGGKEDEEQSWGRLGPKAVNEVSRSLRPN